MRYCIATNFAGLVIAATLLFDSFAVAQEHQLIRVASGATEDIYFEINLSGNLYLSIRSPDGIGCVDLWWIKWPLGNLTQLGKRCGNVRLAIPGISDFAISAKLRARAESKPIAIVASSSEKVAYDFPSVSFP
jgi:hypothetical protein